LKVPPSLPTYQIAAEVIACNEFAYLPPMWIEHYPPE
jgi:hypothetical protein